MADPEGVGGGGGEQSERVLQPAGEPGEQYGHQPYDEEVLHGGRDPRSQRGGGEELLCV